MGWATRSLPSPRFPNADVSMTAFWRLGKIMIDDCVRYFPAANSNRSCWQNRFSGRRMPDQTIDRILEYANERREPVPGDEPPAPVASRMRALDRSLTIAFGLMIAPNAGTPWYCLRTSRQARASTFANLTTARPSVSRRFYLLGLSSPISRLSLPAFDTPNDPPSVQPFVSNSIHRVSNTSRQFRKLPHLLAVR